MKEEQIKQVVREGYAQVALQGGKSRASAGCCGAAPNTADLSKRIGYSDEEMNAVPEGANLGLGCGNPVALASLKEGEVVLDLGSGGGFDCFLASSRVGPKGKVIGVDMTPEMLDRSRANAHEGNYKNVEFRLGEIENLPVADNSVDIIISNCVINLSTDKKRVFKEAFRVLKPGGRLMVSDMVVTRELPADIKDSVMAYIGCISGAIKKDDYLQAIKAAGFKNTRIIDETVFPYDAILTDPTAKAMMDNLKIDSEEAKKIINSMASIRVQGLKLA